FRDVNSLQLLASMLLVRVCCAEGKEANRETTLHASQSGEPYGVRGTVLVNEQQQRAELKVQAVGVRFRVEIPTLRRPSLLRNSSFAPAGLVHFALIPRACEAVTKLKFDR